MSEFLSPEPDENLTPGQEDELLLVPDSTDLQEFFEYIKKFARDNNIPSQDLYYLVLGVSEIFKNRFIFPDEADSGDTNSGGSTPIVEHNKGIIDTLRKLTIPYDPLLEGGTIRINKESMNGGVNHSTNPLIDTEPIEEFRDY